MVCAAASGSIIDAGMHKVVLFFELFVSIDPVSMQKLHLYASACLFLFQAAQAAKQLREKAEGACSFWGVCATLCSFVCAIYVYSGCMCNLGACATLHCVNFIISLMRTLCSNDVFECVYSCADVPYRCASEGPQSSNKVLFCFFFCS